MSGGGTERIGVRIGALLVGVCSVVAGCSSGDSLPPAVLVPTTVPASTAPTVTTTTSPDVDTSSTDEGANTDDGVADDGVLQGLDAGVVFTDTPLELTPDYVFLALNPSDLSALDARFRADERIEPFLDGVDARAVRSGEALAAVVLSVSVQPEALVIDGFTESFVEGATDGGTVSPLPDQLGQVELTSWIADDAGHMLWQHQNLFVIFSGRDLLEVRTVAGIVVATTLGVTLESVLGEAAPATSTTEAA